MAEQTTGGNVGERKEEKERGVDEAPRASLTVDRISLLTRVDPHLCLQDCSELIKVFLAYQSAGTPSASSCGNG
jgi:hypothetical protein